MKKKTDVSLVDFTQRVNSRYQLILFDFDGTLCHTEAIDIRIITNTYKTLGHTPPSPQTIKTTLGTGLVINDLFQSLSPEFSRPLIQQCVRTYKTLYPLEAKSSELFAGVSALLAALKAAGLTLIIVSNKALELLTSTVTALHLDHYFSAIIGVQADQLRKPNPAVYTNFIAPHFPSYQPHEILMIGDTDTDLKFAQALSVDMCWARYGSGAFLSSNLPPPKYIISDIHELLTIILPTAQSS